MAEGVGEKIISPLHLKSRGWGRIRRFKTFLYCFFLIACLMLVEGRAHAITVSVSATVTSNSRCFFLSGNSSLNFGNIDPASPADITAGTNINFFCLGSFRTPAVFYISQDGGLYKTGPGANRMRNTTIATEYLPYSLFLNPVTASVLNWSLQTLTITGVVKASDFQNAYVGNYSDTVVVSILP